MFNLCPFWTALLSFWFLNEVLHKAEVAAMFISMAGIVIIVLGGEKEESTEEIDITQVSLTQLILGISSGVLSSWVFAACNIVTRKIKDIHWSVVLFYHNSVGATSALVAVGLYSLITWQSFM